MYTHTVLQKTVLFCLLKKQTIYTNRWSQHNYSIGLTEVVLVPGRFSTKENYGYSHFNYFQSSKDPNNKQ